MQIDNEFKHLIPALQPEEYALLEKSIISEGIREPLIIWQGILIDGHNRYEISQKHNVSYKTLEKDFASRDDVKIWIINNQLGRRNISAYDRSRLALQLEPLIAVRAKENYLENVGRPSKSCQKSDTIKIDTKRELAKVANVSHDTIAKVKVIEEKATEEVKQKLSSGEVSINSVYQDIKKEERREEVKAKIVELQEKETLPSTGFYDVIVIDPPWHMEKIERDVAPNQVGFDYPTMTIEEIKDFKLPAADNCHLFMWITQKHLPIGFDILNAWNAKYVLTFVWHKNGGFQPFGLPQYNCEFVLYARIGTPQFIDFKNFFTCFNADRTGHSKKPDVFYELVRRVTAGKRIDIFNRREIDGYDRWGNEA
jgi:N6-adenosine-specific RNA methylase IME4